MVVERVKIAIEVTPATFAALDLTDGHRPHPVIAVSLFGGARAIELI
jgi:hypothetical protein